MYIDKTIASKTHKESWDRFIFRIEPDILGEQSMAYKVLKHLNGINKDIIQINNREDKKLTEYYKSLCCSDSPQNDHNKSETILFLLMSRNR